MKFERFSKLMLQQAKKNEDIFSALCPKNGVERLTFLYGKDQHSATIQNKDGEEILTYDGALGL